MNSFSKDDILDLFRGSLNVRNRSPALCHCSKTVFPCESGVSSDRDGVMAGKMSGHMFVVNGYENAVIDINKRQTKGGSK